MATVTIAGAVARGGPFDPDRIAETNLGLHQGKIEGPEIFWTGHGAQGWSEQPA